MKKSLAILCLVLLLPAGGILAQINMKKENGGFLIIEGGKKIAFYQKEAIRSGQEDLRNNFWHPVYLPDGTEITENAPADHPHHRGLFWAWHQILIDGKPAGDPWELKDYQVDVKDVEFKRTGNGTGDFITTAFWRSSAFENGEIPYLKEKAHHTFYLQSGNYRLIKIDLELTALTDKLKLGGSNDEKGYGGFSARIRLPENVRFSGENGNVEPQNTAVEAGQYINITGGMAKNGSQGGVLIYADQKNQSSPQRWILRNKASMQNAVFPGATPVDLQKDVPLKLSYTLVLYTGKIKEKRILKEIEKIYE
ncbi:DUF6807 family protein [Gaoshiqia sp. Z1-71]|uniref:DUF6807 family protein n=1 Tax=Gaoshiqia hydrogeniformans TaxID=3290090 RepID=UPI003BF8814C